MPSELANGMISIFAKAAAVAILHVRHANASRGQHSGGILGNVFFAEKMMERIPIDTGSIRASF